VPECDGSSRKKPSPHAHAVEDFPTSERSEDGNPFNAGSRWGSARGRRLQSGCAAPIQSAPRPMPVNAVAAVFLGRMSWLLRNVACGLLLSRMTRPREYLKRAKRCRELKDQARDNVSRNQLATLEHSYLTLAESSRVLRRSVRLQRALERRHRR
jgi:hypothetical protein